MCMRRGASFGKVFSLVKHGMKSSSIDHPDYQPRLHNLGLEVVRYIGSNHGSTYGMLNDI
ncbi:hypothetical protein M422DRAFT_36896, partial [Sphaerobolus stellatus SS14]